MKHLIIKIYGDVQGVGFRDEAYWTARKLHVAGFVMNDPEGLVYIEAEGEEDALKDFLAWCKKGPITARVKRVETEWSDVPGTFTGFRIG
ncbi:MAG TPA: acylphosphatase [Candidatus Paceibacterota bacterium]|nr:acylphosphatase [Candidatus Paceibacterota bacterium]